MIGDTVCWKCARRDDISNTCPIVGKNTGYVRFLSLFFGCKRFWKK
jgi:hypothetical protein